MLYAMCYMLYAICHTPYAICYMLYACRQSWRRSIHIILRAYPPTQVVSRNVAPVDAGVVSTTFIRGGTAYNIIPGSAVMGGTIRSLSKEHSIA